MTDNDIIKALELCANRTIHSCKFCPCNSGIECSKKLNKETLDLINRQKAEIECLNADLKAAKSEAELLKADNVRLNRMRADVVEVVRCKDCKHKFVEYDGTFTCNIFSNCYGLPYRINLDDFCSHGERRE